ncbi:MAG TPA: diacylglycerol kinase family protein [Solirubrobacteraceae bacterium]
MATNVCLIVNPSAGGGKAGRIAPAVLGRLQELGLQVRRVDTRDLEHARELATDAAETGEIVACLSGDGLIGVIADVLRGHQDAVLGVLPGGRGNDLARVLGIAEDAVEACATIAEGVVRPVDLGLVGDADGPEKAFVGIASCGFDSDANRIANEAPSWLGGLVYAYGALRALASWRPARFEVVAHPSGQVHVFHGYSVAAANSRAYGGGMLIAPHALLDDGQLDLVLTSTVGKLRFLVNLPRVFKGTHVELDSVRSFRAQEVTISADRPFTLYADGDPIGELPVRVRAARAAVKILVPAGEGTAAFDSPPPPHAL